MGGASIGLQFEGKSDLEREQALDKNFQAEYMAGAFAEGVVRVKPEGKFTNWLLQLLQITDVELLMVRHQLNGWTSPKGAISEISSAPPEGGQAIYRVALDAESAVFLGAGGKFNGYNVNSIKLYWLPALPSEPSCIS